MGKQKSKFLRGKRIDPAPIEKNIAVADLIDESFLAYNAARMREACHLFTQKMLEPDVTVGVSLTGAPTLQSVPATMPHGDVAAVALRPLSVILILSIRYTTRLTWYALSAELHTA